MRTEIIRSSHTVRFTALLLAALLLLTGAGGFCTARAEDWDEPGDRSHHQQFPFPATYTPCAAAYSVGLHCLSLSLSKYRHASA